MAEQQDQTGFFDDLDAFFTAAESSDPKALENAAQDVLKGTAGSARPPTSLRPRSEPAHKAPPPLIAPPAPAAPPPPARVPVNLDGKFIAVEPGEAGGEPFVIIPANIHAFLPWWAWLTMALALVLFAAGVFFLPEVGLSQMTARLGGNDPARVQSAMRQLVIKGDERTINRLYAIAASGDHKMEERLRAVDTLSLIADPDADRVLLRLELASTTDSRVRAAAIAARRQREAAKAGGGGR